MANEGNLLIRLTATKSNLKISKQDQVTFDVSGTRYDSGSPSIGTTYEAISLTDVATAGVTFFKNLDATNYVEVGVEVAAAFYPLVKLKPGDVAAMRLATTSIFARANTAACDLEFIVLPD